MKSRHFFIASFLIIMALLSACEQASSQATLRVNLRKDRSIVPENYPLEIESYRITGDGPGSESFSIETNKETVSLEGLVIGEWTILAEGLNSQNDVLVTGSTTHRLSATNGSCTIILEDLVGNGSLEVLLTWDPERIIGEASIELELTPQYGEKETRTLELTSMNTASGEASYTGTDYPAGSYVLAARLFDGSVQVAGFIEAVRIAGDQVSKGEVRFDLDKYPVDPGTLELVNNTGVPVSCTIEGLEDTIDADIPITVSITSATDDVSDYNISWYLDGILIGEGAEAEFTPSVGTHRLDVVASTSRLGTSGSASMNFEAVSAAEPGVPSNGNIINDGENIEISGSGTVSFLPDGSVMIISNAERKIYIASMIRSSIDIRREYSFDDLAISGSIVDACSMEVSAGLSKVVAACEEPYMAMVFNYNPSTYSLTKYSEGTIKFPTSDSAATAVKSVGIVSEVTKDGETGYGFVVARHPEQDYWGIFYVSLVKNTGDEDLVDFGFVAGSATSSANIAGKISTTDQTLFQALADGNAIYLGAPVIASTAFSMHSFAPSEFAEEYLDDFRNITTCSIIGEDNILLMGSSMIILNQTGSSSNRGWSVISSTAAGSEASSLITSADFRYAYYIDIETDEIVTLAIRSSGTAVEEIGRTSIAEDGIDTLSLSRSGTNIIAYDASNMDSLAIYRTTR